VIRVGQGFDLHPFARGRALVLGGVEVPAERGLAGHSDADALSHAVADALLGALALGDLGQHFPDSDPRYRGISSLRLLADVRDKVRARAGRMVSVKATRPEGLGALGRQEGIAALAVVLVDAPE